MPEVNRETEFRFRQICNKFGFKAMDINEETDYGYFKREEWYQYPANFPQRQRSGRYSEVNVLLVSEVTSRSVSMKLRRTTVLKRRQQNVKVFEKSESNRVSKNEINSVLLSSDTDSSQDDNILDLNVGNRRRNEDDVKSQTSSSGTLQKITLVSSAVAEDTLEKLLNLKRLSSPLESEREDIEECESALGESSAEFTVQSGPSSPNPDVNTARCRECESLFSKMRRQTSLKTEIRDKNPASLSYDQWVLLKKWHPQRGRHRKKGLLWTSLVQIRKLAAQGCDSASRTQTFCSRPHVFQQRNLRQCKYLASIQTDPPVTKVKTRHRKRAADWPPIGGKKPVKRKSSMNNTTSQLHFSPKLSISITHKDKAQPDESSRLNTSSRQTSDAASKRKNVPDKFDKQEACDGIEGTRRVLKFDDTPEVVAVETAEQSRGPQRQLESAEICGARYCVETKDSNGLQEELFEDSDGFKTPSDLFSVKPKIKRRGQNTVPASKPTKTSSTANFRSMLATMVKNRNQIIKETFQ